MKQEDDYVKKRGTIIGCVVNVAKQLIIIIVRDQSEKAGKEAKGFGI